jgi:DNA gyrase subunit B
MTDADVDGSHIRTLLLTFFFRQMPELVRRGRIFIAQPPLYQIIRGKSGRYVLNEKVLGDTLTELGLEDAVLVVRDPASVDPKTGEPAEVARVQGQDLRRAVRNLRRLEDLVEIAERRGVKFQDLLATRASDPEGRGRLPTHRMVWHGGEAFAWSEREAHQIIAARGLALADQNGSEQGADVAAAVAPGKVPVTIRELHENRELERVFQDLASVGLNIDDYSLVQEESVTGERLPARFAWITSRAPAKPEAAAEAEEAPEGESPAPAKSGRRSDRVVESPNLASVLGSLHEIGRRGMEIKRFKGLGEMDAEQLWITTMDPSRRTLFRVNWDMASNADSLFSILMGEEVEPRRRFIEDHALEVKNLDV